MVCPHWCISASKCTNCLMLFSLSVIRSLFTDPDQRCISETTCISGIIVDVVKTVHSAEARHFGPLSAVQMIKRASYSIQYSVHRTFFSFFSWMKHGKLAANCVSVMVKAWASSVTQSYVRPLSCPLVTDPEMLLLTKQTAAARATNVVSNHPSSMIHSSHCFCTEETYLKH